MNSKRQRLGRESQEEAAVVPAGEVRMGPREFSTVEEMLRHDAARHPPPDGLAERVAASVRAEPAPRRAWWRRWFGVGPGGGGGA